MLFLMKCAVSSTTDNGTSPESREWRSLRRHESILFLRRQFPSLSREKLIESIFGIWWICSWWREKRVWAFFSRNPLYFSFLKVKANVYTVRPRYNEHWYNEFYTYEQKIWIPIFYNTFTCKFFLYNEFFVRYILHSEHT